MSAIRCALAALALGGAALAAGQDKKVENKLPSAALTALQNATELEVYSLSGRNEKDGWHGAKVLGKATVKKEADRKAIATALKKGVEEGAAGARCFIPRHGVRATHDGKSYDLVICFECHWVYVYTDGSDAPTVLLTTDAAEKALIKVLKDAKVPLAK